MDKLRMESPDMTAQNIDRIAALFPNCVTEASDGHGGVKRAINFELLKQMLSPDVVDGDERYEFTWVGKKAAIVEANKPIRKTLRPCKEESKNWDNTENLYIEGDNLEVLKLLQESYLGKVKMIYIDPPYNTGNDFIYADDFMRSQEEENQQMGMYDEDGDRLFKNTDTNGRFHSDWCSMIYSRLMLARDLLTEDGIIFISIDDNEVHSLRKICDEVFGSHNYLNQFAWVSNITGRQISGCGAAKTWESVLAYCKNIACSYSLNIRISFAKEKMPDSYKGFNKDIRTDSRGLFAIGDTLYNHNRKFNEETRPNLVFSIFYNPQTEEITTGNIGERKDGFVELSPHPNGDGVHKYHAWRWSRQKIEKESYDLIVLRTSKGGYEIYTRIREFDDTLLKDIITNISNGDSEVQKLFEGKKYFDYPKSVDLLSTFIGTIRDKNAIVMDFFSGSATTAHAMMQLNAEDGGHRKFIMVQLPEKCDEASEAYKAGYKNICEIGKERIRRAGEKIKESLREYGYSLRKLKEEGTPYKIASRRENDTSDDPDYISNPEIITGSSVLYDEPSNRTAIQAEMAEALDVGFRVLKLDDTNMKDVYYAPDDYDQGMLAGLESNIKDDRTDLDLLFGCLIDWGLPLSLPYSSEQIDGCTVHTYNGGDLIACFDANIPESVVKEIAQRKPLRAVFRDSGFASSPEKINVFEIFKLYMPEDANDITKRVRVI